MKNLSFLFVLFLSTTMLNGQNLKHDAVSCKMVRKALIGTLDHENYLLTAEQVEKFCNFLNEVTTTNGGDASVDNIHSLFKIYFLVIDHEEQLNEIFTTDQMHMIENRKRQITSNYNFQYENKHAFTPTFIKIETYKQNTVLPTLKEQRLKLEQYISKEDKIEIIKLNSDIHLAEKRKQKFHQMVGEYFPKRLYGVKISPEDRARRNWAYRKLATTDDFKKLTKDLHEIDKRKDRLVSIYNIDVTDLMEEITYQRELWENTIMSYYEDFYEYSPMKEFDPARFMKRYEGEHRIQKIDNESFAFKVQFILDNLSIYEDANEEDLQFDYMTNVFPNPATTSQTLSFTTKQSGIVQIEILDHTGKFVKEILNENKSPGTHQIEVDLSDLSNKLYFYNITSSVGASSAKFLIQR